jgi:hypothetical protein
MLRNASRAFANMRKRSECISLLRWLLGFAPDALMNFDKVSGVMALSGFLASFGHDSG